MELTKEQQNELSSRYEAARTSDIDTLSFDRAQAVRREYFAEIRAAAMLKFSSQPQPKTFSAPIPAAPIAEIIADSQPTEVITNG